MKTLGLVLPMGQSKKLLLRSGQWSLWEQEIAAYKKFFEKVEVFEYQRYGIGRFFESLFLPINKREHWMACNVFKAIHLTGSVPCLIGRWIFQKPYILSYGYRYDQFALIDHKWGQWIMTKLLTPVAIKNATVIVVPTRELRDYIKSMGGKKIVIIPNGVDTKMFSPNKCKHQILKVLFVGRLEKQKNPETLINAVSKFPGKTRLMIVGNGSLKNRLETVAKSLNVSLEIKDAIPNSRLPHIYRRADIFILPSFAEGHPKVLLEAMSCGLSVIASSVPGCRDIVTNGVDGLLVEPTLEDITRALGELLFNARLRRQLGAEARKTIVKTYNKEFLIKREIETIKEEIKT